MTEKLSGYVFDSECTNVTLNVKINTVIDCVYPIIANIPLFMILCPIVHHYNAWQWHSLHVCAAHSRSVVAWSR